MKQKAKRATSWALMGAGAGALLYPAVVWLFVLPELTQAQIALRYWWLALIGFGLMMLGGWLRD